jgi:hypothetical protein
MDLALASPTYEDLIATLVNQRRLLEQLLFRHAQAAMLIAAGEHRFVARAIDEVMAIEADLGTADLARAVCVEALGVGDASLSELTATAPDAVAGRLAKLESDLSRLLAEVTAYREQAAQWAGMRAGRIEKAITSAGNSGYSADGSASALGA